MGLDILLRVTNSKEVFTPAYFENKYSPNPLFQHGLSRTFCNFMCRQNVANVMPELDQIGEITGINISLLYEMEKYVEDYEIQDRLDYAETDEERKLIENQIITNRESLSNNIEEVTQTINNLIERLSKINNLPDLLERDEYDSIGIDDYFSDFNINKGQGYIGNNFGQDLRNFKSFLEYAKAKGSTTVYFSYG